MAKITAQRTATRADGWDFLVQVEDGDGKTQHSVYVPEEYYRSISRGRVKPEELVKHSFVFLLRNESKESIMSEFELPVIQKYFPAYEKAMEVFVQ